MTTKTEVGGKAKKTPSRQSPKVWQVQEFYNLLCDVGLDEWLSSALELRKEKLAQNGSKPKKASDQLKDEEVGLDADDLVKLSVDIDMGKIITHFGQEGGFIELTCIVMGIDEETARDVSLEEFSENFTHFVMESLEPIGQLLSFGFRAA